MTQDSSFTSRSPNDQGFTGTNSNGAWSSFMNNNNIGGSDGGGATPSRSFSWTITFNNYGKQTFDTAVDDTGSVSINGYGNQFNMGGFGGQTSRTTSDYIPPGTYTLTATSNNTGSGPWGIALDWTGYVPPPAANITSFTANPQNQTSGNDGIPNYNTTLNWNVTNAATLTLTSSIGESWNVLGDTSRNITNLPQSTGSGASRSYTLTATNIAGFSVDETITVTVTNDRTPSNSWTTLFSDLEPNQSYTKKLGTLSGIDMIIKVSCPSSGVFFGKSTNGAFANPQSFVNGDDVYIRMDTLPFNTSISGVGSNATFGNTNTKTVSVSVGGLSAFDVNYITKAPRIKESFDYNGESGKYPEPDIDLITNSPDQYGVTQSLTMDNIEIDMEIKGDDPNIQVKIGNGGWKNIREI
jgi:hypothetical protein